MARHIGPRTVQCYHCRHRFEVGGRAESTSCPGCYKPVFVGNITVDRLRAGLMDLRTCGRVTVRRRGRLMVSGKIEAHGGVFCEGKIEAREVVTGYQVKLGPKSEFKAKLSSPVLIVDAGARIESKMIMVPDDPLELGDLPPPPE